MALIYCIKLDEQQADFNMNGEDRLLFSLNLYENNFQEIPVNLKKANF